MKSNYRAIGEFIQLVDNRNIDLKVSKLVGITVNKIFIKSVANTVGTNMYNYKIIKKNQFACSLMQVRRDKKIPVSLFKEREAIISQAYPVFEIIDTTKLLPEYLMMWMSRSEFDREACFYAIGGIRGSLEWEDFCNMKLPIPSIQKQQKIVDEYNTIVDRIKLNEQLNQKLEEMAQAIYKQWFVDFEFPDSEGKSYKSNGGKMVYCEELGIEIPEGWDFGCWDDVAIQFSGFAFKGNQYTLDKGISVLRGENVTEQRLRWDTHKKWNNSLSGKAKNCFLKEYDIVIGMDGSKIGKNWSIVSKYQLPLLLAQRVSCVRAKQFQWQIYLYYSMFINNFAHYVSQVYTGTSIPHISKEQIMNFPILIPTVDIIEIFHKITINILSYKLINNQENFKLIKLKQILLSKLATIKE